MTPLENAAIIASLFSMEAREKRLARQVVVVQVAVTLFAAGIAYSLNGTLPYMVAVLTGGAVSTLNGAMLAWRMSRAALFSAHEAHHQLRLMYFYAAERFLVVVMLLGLCLVALKIPALAVLGGFALGQAVLLAARLLLNR